MDLVATSKSHSDDTNGGWLVWWIAIGSALIMRAARGYRPFPSIDDFAYIPLARAQLDPHLFPRDTIIQGIDLHVPLWPYLVRVLNGTCGVPLGLWLITVALSIATMLVILSWMQVLGGKGLLLPLTAVLAFAAKLPGLGRGEFDGVFGNAFHMQWLALCAMLWTYDAVLRNRPFTAGVLLGITAISHPVVAAHGVVAVTCSTMFSGPGRWRRLLVTGAMTVVVSSPTAFPLLLRLSTAENTGEVGNLLDVAKLSFLFRLGHEYTIETRQLALFVVIAFAGLAGIASIRERESSSVTGTFFGLQLGHVFLLGCAAYFHSDLFPNDWMSYSLAPFLLHLTRTTPVLLTLSMVAFVTAIEREFLQRNRRSDESKYVRIGWLFFWALCGTTLLFFLLACVEWTLILAGMMVLCIMTVFVSARPRFRSLAVASWCVAGGLGIVWFGYTSQLEAPVSTRDKQLYQWIQASTPTDALFIIPPGQIEFRYYAERSVYIEFKLFAGMTPDEVYSRRRRLEEVASPDKIAMKSTGWAGITEWDRTYANRNTPTRIVELLETTGADYLLWNADGLKVPPYVSVQGTADPRVAIVYERDGYKVFQLTKDTK